MACCYYYYICQVQSLAANRYVRVNFSKMCWTLEDWTIQLRYVSIILKMLVILGPEKSIEA